MDLTNLTINEAHEAIIKKQFSISELVLACLNKIKEADKTIQSYITVCEEALLEAKTKDGNLDINDNSKKLLYGIPIAVKDIFSTIKVKTTAGSKVLENYFPVFDATVVKRLKENGAIIIGKTNCDAWAHGSSGENSDYFVTKNPYDLKRTPGGSSSGSAASLAARMCLGSTGTDTGGSIRLPASFCNVVGLKPTYGRVSRYGIIAMASSFDSIGHFTKTVEDSAIILSTTAGKDKFDATTSNLPVPNYLQSLNKNVKDLKIGLPKEYFTEGIDQEVRAQIDKAVKTLEEEGIKFETISLPFTNKAMSVYYIIQPSEVSSNLARFDGIRFGFERNKFSDEAKRRIMIGTFSLSSGYQEAYYLQATKVRTLVINDFKEVFKKVDLILTPTSPTPPFLLGEKLTDPLKMYLSDIFTTSANIAGIPGLVIPAGFTQGNLPCGVQLLADHFREDLLFTVGNIFEKKTNYWKIKPNI